MAFSKNSFETKLLKAKDFKEQGTKLLNEGNFKAANGKFHQVLDSLGGKEIGLYETEGKDLIQANDLFQAGRLNIALCQMKMKEWKKAKSTCSKIIQANADVAKVGGHFNSNSFETLNVNLQDLYLVHLMRATNFTKH